VKKILIIAMVVVFMASMLFVGTSCKQEAAAEEVAEEEVAEEEVPPAEKGVLTYMFWLGEEDSFYGLSKDIINEFNQRTDVNSTIEFQYATGTEYYTKLNASIAAGNAPDIFICHAAGKLKTYVDAGIPYALNADLDADPAWRDNFVSGVFGLMTFDGNIYAAPLSQTSVPLFYNTEIFSTYGLTPPETYEDLKNVITVLTNNGITPFAFTDKDTWTGALFAELVSNRIGGDDPYNAVVDGTGSWEDPSFIRSGEIMQKLAAMGAFQDDFLGLGYESMTTAFNTGEAAMIVMGSWIIGGFDDEGSTVNGKVGIAKFPTMPDGVGSINVWMGQPDANLVISETCTDKESAIEFLKMWNAEDVQHFIGEDAGKILVTKTTLDTTKVSPVCNDLVGAMSDMEGMFIFYDVGLGAVIGDEYNNTIQAILGGKDPAQAFADLQTYTEANRE